MLETIILLIFSAILIVGISTGIPLYVSLFFGFVMFSCYGIYKGKTAKELFHLSAEGLTTIGPILLLFILIGMLTASWRAAGTIPAITCYSSRLVQPSTLILLTFILSSAMGLITGSAFATSATIGVICMTIGNAMGANPALVGGAVLSGCFFGDRTSPMSGSSNLVASLTDTKLFTNLNRMIRTAIVPLIICCVTYHLLGNKLTGSTNNDFTSLFINDFDLSWYVITPTLVIIALSLFKVSVKKSMVASLLLAIAICVTTQGYEITQIPSLLVFGYHTQNEAIAPMVNGGGILSMAHISLVICVASTYSGLFKGTGLLDGLHAAIIKLSRRTTAYTGVLATAIVTTGIACDQTLSIMLTYQLCDEVEADGEALALDLLNSSSITCSLMPWTTSCMGCLAFMNAPYTSCALAIFPITMCAWFMILSVYNKKHPKFVEGQAGQLLGFTEKDDVRNFLDADNKLIA